MDFEVEELGSVVENFGFLEDCGFLSFEKSWLWASTLNVVEVFPMSSELERHSGVATVAGSCISTSDSELTLFRFIFALVSEKKKCFNNLKAYL